MRWSLVLFAALCACGSPARAADALPNFRKLWDYDHPAKSEQRFRELLPRAEQSGDKPYLAQLLTQIARAQGLQSHFEEAHRTLDRAQALITDDMKVARIYYLLERGRVYNSAHQPEKAKPLFLQALDVAQAAGNEALAIDAAHMMGIVETGAKALEWNLKTIRMVETAKDPSVRGWLGPLYNNTGWTYYDQKDYARALDLLQKAQAYFEKHGSPVEIRIAKYSVAKTLRAQGKIAEALAIQEAVRDEMEKVKEPDGYVYEEIGECLLAQDKKEEARKYFGLAYDLLAKDPDLAGEPKRLQRIKELGGR